MTDSSKDKGAAEQSIEINGNADNSASDNLPDENPAQKIKALQESLDKKNSSYDDLYERFLRIAADFDNYKKRMTKEKTDLVTYGNEELIKALLNVIDNLERALEHSGAEGSSESIIKGVDLVYKQFISCLEKFGLSKINAEKGTKFDPNYHQAVEHMETDDITPGLIVNEMIKGYLLKERLLRPSMVAVSKGISKKPQPAPEQKEPEPKEPVAKEQEPEKELELDLSDKEFNIDDFKIELDDDSADTSGANNTNGSDNASADGFNVEINIDDNEDIVELMDEDIEEK